jgi:phytoene dehydrogenase-like protein
MLNIESVKYRMNETAYDVIVIGAGVSGLCAAAQLSHHGLRVLVVERHQRVGGNCASWERKVPGYDHPFTFDCGVQDISGLGPCGPLSALFNSLDAKELLRWHRVQHLYFRNGITVAGGGTEAEFIDGLCEKFPKDADGIRALFHEIRAIYHEIYSEGMLLPANRHDVAMLSKRPNTVRWLKHPFTELLNSHVSDPDARAILRIISEYITEDSEAPFVEEMAPLYGYYFYGGYYPEGGAQNLPDTLAAISRRQDGVFRLGTSVEEILIENGEIVGVLTTDGDRISTKAVACNRDALAKLVERQTANLLPERYTNRLRRMKPGPSAIVISVGLSTVMPLPARIFIQQGNLSFGVGNPSVIDPTLAPAGCSAVTLLHLISETEAATWLDKTAPNYAARKDAVAEALFTALESSVFPKFRDHILYKEITTPASFVSYTRSHNGNIYGAACAAWRPGPQSPIPGLWLIGAATETGPGIEAVALSGLKAANHILANLTAAPSTNKKLSDCCHAP